MNNLYKDKLIEITGGEVVFHYYYFPLGGEKRIPLGQIEKVLVRQPSLFGGSWRLWGSGDLRMWFPLDMRRPSRTAIFIAFLRDSCIRIGFTVEDAPEVGRILKELDLSWKP